MKISQLKKKYKNKWILAEVTKKNKLHHIEEVKPLLVSEKRRKVYERLIKVKKGTHVATIYTGETPPKGLVFTFYAQIKI